MRIFAGLNIDAKAAERVAEGIGEDMEAWWRREREALPQEAAKEGVVQTIPVLYISADGFAFP